MHQEAWTLAYQGSVNRWECDENDHLNVRFYVRMVREALISACRAWKLGSPARILSQHMRYLAEARLATPITGYCRVVETDEETVTVLTELRHAMSGTVLAAFVSCLDTPKHPLSAFTPLTLPDHAGPRGVPDVATPFSRLKLTEAVDAGFQSIGMGVVDVSECDSEGNLLVDRYMWRMSDSMPNLWSIMQSEDELNARAEGFQGGAVVEYRMEHHAHLRAGDCYKVVSALSELGRKTQHFVHLMFNTATASCVMSAQAVGVVLDLQTRRSMEIPEARRNRMNRFVVRLED